MRLKKRKIRKKAEKYNRIILSLGATIFLLLILLTTKHVVNSKVFASEKTAYTKFELNESIEQKNEEHIEEQVDEKNNSHYSEIIEEEIELEYITLYETDDTLPNGMIQIRQEGRTGIQQVVVKKTYENGELIDEEKISDKIIKAAVNKIVVTGTSKNKSSYKVKAGDTLYVTSNILSIRKEKDDNAEKVTTIEKNTAVVLSEKGSKWHKIIYDNYEGYALAESLTYINPNVEESEEGPQKSNLISNLSFDMDISKPSKLSLEQFEKIFTNREQDVNSIFEDNAQYFYYAEKQYDINGVFLAAVAVHESNWGKSAISKEKKNLFGYGANDANHYGDAYAFSDYREGIDLVARALVKYYLHPAGTKIYDGEIASGVYYNGSTISGVNTRYASDKNWANCVYNYMKLFYENL